MVKLFLTFVYADREADWKVHLSSFSEIIRHDRAFDHLKYFRWGLVYLVDMVSPVMTSEQSQNKDFKVKGGLSGIVGKDETRERWTLTAHPSG